MVPGNLYSRAVLPLDFPHLTHVKIDLKHGFPQRHNGARPLLEHSCRGKRLASDVVDACPASLRRGDDKILIEPGQSSDLPRGRVRRRKEDDLRTFLPEPLPLPVPIDVEANLNSYCAKVRFEHRRIMFIIVSSAPERSTGQTVIAEDPKTRQIGHALHNTRFSVVRQFVKRSIADRLRSSQILPTCPRTRSWQLFQAALKLIPAERCDYGCTARL